MLKAAGLDGLLAVLLCFAAVAHAQKGPQELTPGQLQDREALIALKTAVAANGYGRSKLASWKIAGNPCSPKPWPGLQCWSGRVTGLLLSNLNIQGTLPVQLRQLNELVTLKLDGNRFTGTLPVDWADPRYFIKLKTLDLHDNLLDGTLPSQKWNRKGAFRSLQFLYLNNNGFYGGLPFGWLSTNKVFRQLKELDLSNNKLGTSDGVRQYKRTEEWCQKSNGTLGADDPKVGWCPAGTPLPGALGSLLMLDISDNLFTGKLPSQWPKMFPQLRTLLIANNNLWAVSEAWTSDMAGRPSALHASWTQPTYPVAFPSLESLMLYPGNENICFLPNVDISAFQSNGYAEVNKDKTYRLMDTDNDEYNTNNPWPCVRPGLSADGADIVSIPEELRLVVDPATNSMQVTWSLPDDAVPFVFGFKVTLYWEDVSNGDWTLNTRWNGKLYRTYTDLEFTAIPGSWGLTITLDPEARRTRYSLLTGAAAIGIGGQKVEVVTFNLDAQDSAPAEALWSGDGGGTQTKTLRGCNDPDQPQCTDRQTCQEDGTCEDIVCPAVPCTSTVEGYAMSSTRAMFTNPADGSTNFPAGRYQVFYVEGCLDYNRQSLAGIEWCVGFQPSYWYDRAWYVEYQGATTAATQRLFTDSTKAIEDICSKVYSECVARAQATLKTPTTFMHSGGPIAVYLSDNPYSDNIAGYPSPTWKLQALDGSCAGQMAIAEGQCCDAYDGVTCSSTCCEAGSSCFGADHNQCCPAGQDVCGLDCCIDGQVCVGEASSKRCCAKPCANNPAKCCDA